MKALKLTQYLASKDAKTLAVFGIIVVLAAQLSRAVSVESLPISVLWPPTGMIFGAALIYGRAALAFVGPLIALWLVLFQEYSIAAAMIQTLSQLVGIGVGLWYLQKRNQAMIPVMEDVSDFVVYVKAAVIVASVSAALGTFSIWVASAAIRSFTLADIFLVYWLLELLSIMLFAPLAYLVLNNPGRFLRNISSDIRRPATAASILSVAGVALFVFLLPQSADITYTLAILLMFFPALCWLVMVGHPATITLALPTIFFGVVAFVVFGIGAVPRLTSMDNLVRLLLLFGFSALLLQIVTVVNFLKNQLVETLNHQAKTDFLSGLKNDRAFLSVISDLVKEHRQAQSVDPASEGMRWLVYMEVLNFDNLEDLMGFRAIGIMETLLSARLMGSTGPECMPARLGNGSYAAVFESSETDTVEAFYTRLYQAFDGESFSVGDHQTRIRVSISAVALDGSLEDPKQYLSGAIHGALLARDRHPRVNQIDDPQALTLDRMGLTKRLELLKNALSEDRLVLFAQPIKPLGRDDPGLSYEILLRLKGDDGDFISPGIFLPVAEAYGFMKQIDQWVIRSTLEALSANPEWLGRTQKCSINLAGASLSSSEIIDTVEQAFQATGVPREKITFEVTETQQIDRREEAETIIAELRAMGCGVSLDDFGTGLATFDYLKSFQFDTVKIDGVFIKNIKTSVHDAQIVQAICDVARWMGLTTVAEFVEDDASVDLLKALGVDYGQGFGLGKPVPLPDLFECRHR